MYSMLQMGLLESNVYKFIIIAIIHSIFIFNIINSNEKSHKLELVYYPIQTFLLMYKPEPYWVKLGSTTELLESLNIAAILEIEDKNPLIIILSQLVPGVQAIDSFYTAFIDFPKS